MVERDRNLYLFVSSRPTGETPTEDPVATITTKIGNEVARTFHAWLHNQGRDVEPANIWAHGAVGFIWAVADRWIVTNLRRPGPRWSPTSTSSSHQHSKPNKGVETMTISPTGEALRRALDGPFHAIKQRWRDEVTADDVVRDTALSMEDARAWTLDGVVRLAHRQFVTAGFPTAQGGTGTAADSVANFEMVAMGDLSLTIKSGVQHGLFGGAIVNLGTQWHHETFLPDAISVDLPGCFAMTELGHGSDVQSIETSITWDPETSEFVVHSPPHGHEGLHR
ncbi:acyl-CoA dehydrogenase family protein [Tessaracoccus coleopterorum]|uniref:acyl-CoA dehydrogenase family protein n=1 Tax=Tessaracoccus coleopterorum TaxID=2714950 RepID=UPI0018D2C562